MRQLLLLFILLAGCSFQSECGIVLRFDCGAQAVVAETPDKTSGLEGLYVLRNASGVTVSIDVADAGWYVWNDSGGAYARPAEVMRDAASSAIRLTGGDTGIAVEISSRRYYFWITDYKTHELRIEGVRIDADCEQTVLFIDGNAEPIYYFGSSGRRCILDRGLKLSYRNQNVADRFSYYDEKMAVQPSGGRVILPQPALCATTFTLRGDRFEQMWGKSQQAEAMLENPVAVAVSDDAEDIDGEKDAPYELSLQGFSSEGVAHEEWQIASDADFTDVTHRITGADLDFTFRRSGVYYIRFSGLSANGECEAFSETKEIVIKESLLECPNTLVIKDGATNVWRPQTKSIESYRCQIFDRYGVLIFSSDNPENGWDGKKKGKYVATGVYYYVIEAMGADGCDYRLAGHINVLKERIYR